MTVDVGQQVQSCEELLVGDPIEAWHNGKLFHRGKVIRTVADTDLFWILDERTGTRRLIDAEVLVVRRVPVAAAAAGAGAAGQAGALPANQPAPAALRPGSPASHVPLFQAPALLP
ncbi:hypothetical protein [Pseudarthrobacter sp. 1C304]|uniref:hypothetical protein n=1 Tax=Pseudarthrobacter sp. 1C304 TaxID=3457438 RepID=UPI003FD0567A